MPHFKKDNTKLKAIRSYIATFMSGFIIALFFILFVLMMVVNNMKNNSINPSSITDSSSEPTSGEIDSINSEIDESSSSYIDPYINEKAIIANLLTIAQDYEDSVTTISNISYDTDYIYLFTSSDEYYFIMTIELDIYD